MTRGARRTCTRARTWGRWTSATASPAAATSSPGRSMSAASRAARRDAARRDPLLPAARRAAVRLDADIARRRRRNAAVRQDRGPRPVSIEPRAPVPRLRAQRPRVPAARRSARVEHVGRLLRSPPAPVLSALPVELQLVAVLDHRGTAGGARVQYQHAHDIPEYVVVAFRRDDRTTGNHVLL